MPIGAFHEYLVSSTYQLSIMIKTWVLVISEMVQIKLYYLMQGRIWHKRLFGARSDIILFG